jgi:hypothetical protein
MTALNLHNLTDTTRTKRAGAPFAHPTKNRLVNLPLGSS